MMLLYNKDRSEGVIYGKDRFRIYIFYGLKISRNFEIEFCKGERGRGNISKQLLLKMSKSVS